MPGSVQAGQYSAVTHYLKAVGGDGPDKAKASGRAAVEQMKAMPTDDPMFGKGTVRIDGRVIHDMHLFEVKSPAAVEGAVGLLQPYGARFRRIRRFRPLDQGGCPLVRS